MSRIRRLLIAACAGLVLSSTLAVSASAIESYTPYSYDRWGEAVPSQVGYTAEYFVTGDDIDKDSGSSIGSLSNPSDMYISADDLMYIVDTGNNRIVVTDLDFNLIATIDTFNLDNAEGLEDFDPESDSGYFSETLKSPTGIFVDQYSGDIYIADTENSRVPKTDIDGNVSRVVTRPTNSLYSSDLTFNPSKVCVDKAGNIYVVVRSVTKGAVMYDDEGEFLGFYGANRVEATAEVILNAFVNTFRTEEQRSRVTNSTPVGFSNFDIDDEGFIYTVTESTTTTTDLVKKLSPEGENILSSLGVDDVTWGDEPPTYYSIYSQSSSLIDIDIGDNGEMNILDFAHGRVFQYDKLGNLMFIVGGSGEQLGLFRTVTAIESRGDKIYVADGRKNSITVFERTTFGEIVTNATNLYNDGYYAESYEPWLTVIKYDGNYRRAYIGVGNALLSNKQYKEAMDYFEISISRARYNRAFEGYRDELLEQYFTPAIIIIIVLLLAWWIYKLLVKNGTIKPRKRKGGA